MTERNNIEVKNNEEKKEEIPPPKNEEKRDDKWIEELYRVHGGEG